jgi:hypothetical protein
VDFDEDVLAIFDAAARACPNDIDAAAERAEAELRRREDFASLVAELVRRAVREAIHRARHEMTRAAKGRAYGGPAKVLAASAAVEAVCASWYDNYCIGRRTLGDLLGEELEPLACDEEARARGCADNARLLRWLREKVKDGQRVRDAVPERKAMAMFHRISREQERQPPAAAAAGH